MKGHEVNRQSLGKVYQFERVDHLELLETEELLEILREHCLPEYGDRSEHIIQFLRNEVTDERDVIIRAIMEFHMNRAGIECSDRGVRITH